MFRPKKTIIPARYGTIERRTQFKNKDASKPDWLQTSTEQVVLREAEIIETGGLYRRVPIYEIRSERKFINSYTIVDETTGEEYVKDGYFKTITKQVQIGSKIEFGLDDFSKRKLKENLSYEKTEKRAKNIAVSMLQFFLPSEYCDALVGDLFEEYDYKSLQLNKLVLLWLAKEVIFTLFNVFLDWFLKRIPISFKIGS